MCYCIACNTLQLYEYVYILCVYVKKQVILVWLQCRQVQYLTNFICKEKTREVLNDLGVLETIPYVQEKIVCDKPYHKNESNAMNNLIYHIRL